LTMIDWCFRLAYRLAYPIMDRWWRIRGNHHGALTAVWLDDRVLGVRHSYKPGLRLPGGGTAQDEDHRVTAARELEEEVGVVIDPAHLRYVLTVHGCHGRMHLYEAHLEAMPALTVDRREIVEAAFVPPSAINEHLPSIVAYLRSHRRCDTMGDALVLRQDGTLVPTAGEVSRDDLSHGSAALDRHRPARG
jgi:8-oxo-dGTP diphosphatase